jgi:hypothetical protein
MVPNLIRGNIYEHYRKQDNIHRGIIYSLVPMNLFQNIFIGIQNRWIYIIFIGVYLALMNLCGARVDIDQPLRRWDHVTDEYKVVGLTWYGMPIFVGLGNRPFPFSCFWPWFKHLTFIFSRCSCVHHCRCYQHVHLGRPPTRPALQLDGLHRPDWPPLRSATPASLDHPRRWQLAREEVLN